METIIDQALGYVFHSNAAGFLDRHHVNNTFVRHAAIGPFVDNG